MFSGPATMFPQHAKTEALLQEDGRPIPVAKFHQLRQRTKVTVVHVERFSDYELSSDFFFCRVLQMEKKLGRHGYLLK